MKKIIFLFSLLFVLAACGCETAPLFKPLRPVYKRLSNGMELFLLEDHELPTAEFTLYIRGGSVYDPLGREGLSSVAMQTIRLGGIASPTLSPDQIEETLESVGASLEMGTSEEFHSASLSLLKKDLDVGLGLLFDLLERPSLRSDRFENVKKRVQEALQRKKEEPLSLAYLKYPGLVYGKESWWGREPTLESIERITLDEVKNFHRQFIHPDRMILAASGDFSIQEIVEKIEKRQKGWVPVGTPLSPIPLLQEDFRGERRVIPKKGLTQTTVVMGHLGGKRDNPDKFPLLVMNFILGGSGGLTSRLGEEIRSSAGKAYAVWSDFGFGSDYGLFRVVAQTALQNTGWVVQKMESMIREMWEKPAFREEEITRAKQAILRSLFFEFETRSSQVKQQALFHLWGYPENYLTLYQKGVARVKKADLERVARKYLHPEGLKVLLVTDEKEVK